MFYWSKENNKKECHRKCPLTLYDIRSTSLLRRPWWSLSIYLEWNSKKYIYICKVTININDRRYSQTNEGCYELYSKKNVDNPVMLLVAVNTHCTTRTSLWQPVPFVKERFKSPNVTKVFKIITTIIVESCTIINTKMNLNHEKRISSNCTCMCNLHPWPNTGLCHTKLKEPGFTANQKHSSKHTNLESYLSSLPTPANIFFKNA